MRKRNTKETIKDEEKEKIQKQYKNKTKRKKKRMGKTLNQKERKPRASGLMLLRKPHPEAPYNRKTQPGNSRAIQNPLIRNFIQIELIN